MSSLSIELVTHDETVHQSYVETIRDGRRPIDSQRRRRSTISSYHRPVKTGTPYKEHRAFRFDSVHQNTFVSWPPQCRIRRTYHCVLQLLIGIVLMIVVVSNRQLERFYNNYLNDSLELTNSFEYRILHGPNNLSSILPPQQVHSVVWWNGENSTQQHRISESVEQHQNQKSTKRKQRCRPTMDQSSLLAVSTLSILHQPSTTKYVQGMDGKIGNQTQSGWNWKDLCRKANLNKYSRVLITNAIATSKIGPAVSLLIAKQCQVRSVTAVDPLLPNVHSLRIHAMHLYRILYQSIPNFKLIVPMASAGIATMPDKKKHPTEKRATLLWLENLSPTHIIHLDPIIAMDNTTESALWKNYMSNSAHRIYQLQNSVLSLQQILQYCHEKYRRDNTILQLLNVMDSTTATTKKSMLDAATMFTGYDPSYVDTVNVNHRIRDMLIDFYHSETDGDVSFHTLAFGAAENIEDILASILLSLQQNMPPHQLLEHHHIESSLPSPPQSKKPANSLLFDPDFAYNGRGNVASPLVQNIPDNEAEYFRELYGIHLSHFPCASSCRNSFAATQCASTVFDTILHISRQVTVKCQFAVYMVDYNINLETLYETQTIGRTDMLCRLAFVSSQSNVAQEALNKMVPTRTNDTAESLQQWNGKLAVNGWTLIWLPMQQINNFETTVSISEYALALMEPSKLFGESVHKAMYVDNADIAQASDATILRIMQQIDHRALPKHYVRERRSGMDVVSRFVERPATAARSVAMFISEPSKEYRPKSYEEYIKRIHNISSIPEMSLTMSSEFYRRLNFYKDVKSYLMQDHYRPDIETSNTISTIYPTFPWQWISMDVIVHDLTMETARLLRCSWYDEYLYWADPILKNSNSTTTITILLDIMEELSFAYFIGIQRMKGLIGPNIDDETSWIPMYEKKSSSSPPSQQNPSLQQVQHPVYHHNDKNNEVFLRVMKHIQ